MKPHQNLFGVIVVADVDESSLSGTTQTAMRKKSLNAASVAMVADTSTMERMTMTKPPHRQLRGLEKVCRLYGRMKCGDTMMSWDYANEIAVPESDMPMGSERWKASEKAKFHPAAVKKLGLTQK